MNMEVLLVLVVEKMRLSSLLEQQSAHQPRILRNYHSFAFSTVLAWRAPVCKARIHSMVFVVALLIVSQHCIAF